MKMPAKDVKLTDHENLIIPVEAKGKRPSEYLDEMRKSNKYVILRRKGKAVGGLEAMFMQSQFNSIFGGCTWEKDDFSPLPINYPLPSKSQVNRAAEILRMPKNLCLLS